MIQQQPPEYIDNALMDLSKGWSKVETDTTFSYLEVRLERKHALKDGSADHGSASDGPGNGGDTEDGNANSKKCALAASTTYQAAQLRSDGLIKQKPKGCKLRQGEQIKVVTLPMRGPPGKRQTPVGNHSVTVE
jgi:hypothetical protein